MLPRNQNDPGPKGNPLKDIPSRETIRLLAIIPRLGPAISALTQNISLTTTLTTEDGTLRSANLIDVKFDQAIIDNDSRMYLAMLAESRASSSAYSGNPIATNL